MSALDFKDVFLKKAKETSKIIHDCIIVEGPSDYEFFKKIFDLNNIETYVIFPYNDNGKSEVNFKTDEEEYLSKEIFNIRIDTMFDSKSYNAKYNNKEKVIHHACNNTLKKYENVNFVLGIIDSDFNYILKLIGRYESKQNVLETPCHDLETYLLKTLIKNEKKYESSIGIAFHIGQLLSIERIKKNNQESKLYLSDFFNSIRHSQNKKISQYDFWKDIYFSLNLEKQIREYYSSGANCRNIKNEILGKNGVLSKYENLLELNEVKFNNDKFEPQSWPKYEIMNGHDFISLVSLENVNSKDEYYENKKIIEHKVIDDYIKKHNSDFWNDSNFGMKIAQAINYN